jgi:hypothetical protein
MPQENDAPVELRGVLTLADTVAARCAQLLDAYLPKDAPAGAGGDQPPLPTERLPGLLVALTFAERSDRSPAQFHRKLKTLFLNILTHLPANAAAVGVAAGGATSGAGTVAGGAATGAAIAGPLGAGLGLLTTAYLAYRKANPADPTATDLAALLKRFNSAEKDVVLKWPNVKKNFASWLREAGHGGSQDWLSARTWRELADQLTGTDSTNATPPTTPAPSAVPGQAAIQADGTATTSSAASSPTAEVTHEPFKLVQLTGWLRQSADGKFDIAIYSNFATKDREIARGGRLDILGPDGSQLYTQYTTSDELAGWLDGSSGINIDWSEAPDLQRVIEQARQRDTDKRKFTTVRGRLWRSDGTPFGVRQFAIFAPPDFSSHLSDCCLEEALEAAEPDCCCEDERVFPATIRAPQALAISETDEAGYFEFYYREPEAGLKSKFALLELAGGRATLALTLEKVGEDLFRFPQTLLLPIDAEALPSDAEKNIEPFNDDAPCCGTRFDETNRALEEFDFNLFIRTSDPAINRPGANGTSDLSPDRFFRTGVGRETPVLWNSDDVLSQAQTVAHGRILTIRQTWMADGYSLGDLLYSLPLAPLQKKNIAVIDWDRGERVTRESEQTNVESLNAYIARDRDISEIVSSSFSESVRARSESGSRASSGSSGLFGSIFGGSSGGGASAWSTASQDVGRTLTGNFLNQLRDRTNQAANNFRSQRVTTVQQVNQSEKFRAMTETVANRNACHAVTIQYFEVLRHFKISYQLAQVRECLFIPLPVAQFDGPMALRWRSILEKFVPTQELADSFAACHRLVHTATDYASGRECDQLIEALSGEAVFSFNFPMPTVYRTAVAFQSMAEYPMLDLLAPEMTPMWGKSEAERVIFFQQVVVPMLLRTIIDGLELGIDKQGAQPRSLPLQGSIAATYSDAGSTRIRVDVAGDVIPTQLTRGGIDATWLQIAQRLPSDWRLDLVGLDLRYATPSLRTSLVSQEVPVGRFRWQIEAVSQSLRVQTPMTRVEVANPRDADLKAQASLIEHLNSNVELYHKLIWWHMDADRRFGILDGFLAPNAGGRSVASVVENRLAGIVGNALVMPISPGMQLDHFDELRKGQSDENGYKRREEENGDALLAAYRPSIANPSSRISVPTRGVFAESVLGSCNACEQIDDTRNWRYWEHPLPDQPTEIQPISAASRRADVPFAVPPVPDPNLRQAPPPQAPDPGVLVQQLATALTNLAAVKDYAGLPGTQANARDALQGSFETTQAAYEIASNLLMKGIQAAASAYTGVPLVDAEKVKASVGKDVKSGRMTREQGQDTVTKINDTLIDQLGGSKIKSLLEQPEVSAAVGMAADKGAPMRLERGDTMVELGAAPTPIRRKSWLRRLFFRLNEANAATTATQPGSRLHKTTYVARDVDVFMGEVIPNGQCVAYVKAAANCPVTTQWTEGGKVKGAELPKGTAIATFQNGKYNNYEDGRSHAAIYISQNKEGLIVRDQWMGQPVHERTIRFWNGGKPPRNDGDAYSVVAGP